MSRKSTNPKQVVGDGKLPLHLVPESMEVYASLAFLEGALKYGAHNYKCLGVRASTYLSAAKRHMKKWVSGEDCDPRTKVPHLASALACLAIIVDGVVTGNITDDRPPSTPVAALIDDAEAVVSHLRETFAGRKPRNFSIGDGVRRKSVKKVTSESKR